MRFLYFLILSANIGLAQNSHKGILVDADDKNPIEFVGVYNGVDYTSSNADGKFLFTSSKDSIIFYRAGYKKLSTTFSQLSDTIFLERSPYELEEVILTNAKSLWQKITDSIRSNYVIAPYKEKFFLRGILKYNDEITRIQDLQGKLQRKTLLYNKDLPLTTKDYLVELSNMRKIGVVKDDHNVYFKFPTLFGLFSSFVRLNATGEGFILTEKSFQNEEKIRLEFQSDPAHDLVDISGYYLINTTNNAIEEFHVKSTPKNPPFKEKKWVRYRTTYYELSVFFEKKPVHNKYFMRQAKSREIVETSDKKKTFSETYDSSFIFSTSHNFEDFPIKKNINATKDIFRLKYPYNATFWKSQNQLLLTNEMLDFIKKANNNKEFKISSNIK